MPFINRPMNDTEMHISAVFDLHERLETADTNLSINSPYTPVQTKSYRFADEYLTAPLLLPQVIRDYARATSASVDAVEVFPRSDRHGNAMLSLELSTGTTLEFDNLLEKGPYVSLTHRNRLNQVTTIGTAPRSEVGKFVFGLPQNREARTRIALGKVSVSDSDYARVISPQSWPEIERILYENCLEVSPQRTYNFKHTEITTATAAATDIHAKFVAMTSSRLKRYHIEAQVSRSDEFMNSTSLLIGRAMSKYDDTGKLIDFTTSVAGRTIQETNIGDSSIRRCSESTVIEWLIAYINSVSPEDIYDTPGGSPKTLLYHHDKDPLDDFDDGTLGSYTFMRPSF